VSKFANWNEAIQHLDKTVWNPPEQPMNKPSVLTSDEINEIAELPLSQNDWHHHFARAVEAAVLAKLAEQGGDEKLQAKIQEQALRYLSLDGQAAELQARVDELSEKLRIAGNRLELAEEAGTTLTRHYILRGEKLEQAEARVVELEKLLQAAHAEVVKLARLANIDHGENKVEAGLRAAMNKGSGK